MCSPSVVAISGIHVSFIDARDLVSPARLEADVCIVGGGAAGITIASELLGSGLDICLVESGGFTPDAETQARVSRRG